MTLANGTYDGPPSAPGAASHPTLVLWEPAVVFGDVDGAPGNEAVAMLAASGGASGEFVYVAVFGVRDGALVNLGTAAVGDRTKLQSLWLQGGKVVMDVVEAGPQDAACCPTQLARKVYAFEGGALKMSKSEVLGTLTLGALSANEWQLVSIDGQPVPADAKPPVIHFERDSIRGFAGCNRFTSPIKETAPGRIEVGPAAATRMACPGPEMDLEQKFLAELGKANGYTFLAGQLALTWSGKDGNGAHAVREVAYLAAPDPSAYTFEDAPLTGARGARDADSGCFVARPRLRDRDARLRTGGGTGMRPLRAPTSGIRSRPPTAKRHSSTRIPSSWSARPSRSM